MDIIDNLCKIYSDIHASRTAVSEELALLPQGDLQCYKVRGRIQYTQVTYHLGKRIRHGINRDNDLIRKLARKRFLNERLSVLDHNLALLEDIREKALAFAPESVIQALPSSIRSLPEEYFLIPEDYTPSNDYSSTLKNHLKRCAKWADSHFEQSSYRPHLRKITTTRGLKVRSKSEALIANILHEKGVPFRYEQIVYLGNSTFSPDFSFLTSDDTEIYWEHAGLLSDTAYSFRHHLKMMQYESAGLYPWRNVIVTYDTDNEINTRMVESIIENILFPALLGNI